MHPRRHGCSLDLCHQRTLSLYFIRLKHCQLVPAVYLQGRHVIGDIKGLWFEYRSKYRLSPQHCRECDQINIDKSVRNSKNQMPIRTYSTIPNNLLVTSKIPIRVHTTTLNYQRKSVLAPVLYTSTFLGQECKIVANHKV